MNKYKFKKGDTLWIIAKKYYGDGNLYTLICRANKIDNPDIVKVGKELIIPDKDLTELIKPITNWEYSATEEDIKKAMTNKPYIEIILEEKDKEITRLNNIIKQKDNIINELEKWIKENNLNELLS